MKTILPALIMFALPSFGAELIKFNDFLKTELSASSKTAKESFTLTPEQAVSLKKVSANATETAFTFYYGKTADGKIEKSCTVVPQQGKEGPMSVGVCFSNDGAVAALVVLSHEEERGKKVVEGKDFIKQFKGKKASSPFKIGKDIDVVTGASKSSEALSEAVRKASFAFTQFVENKK